MMKRRKPPKSGIQRAPRREYPKHRQHIRGFECAVGNRECEGAIQAAHVRLGTDGGEGLLPSDWFLYPLCFHHHIGEQHATGERTFEAQYFPKGLRATALEYARRSPLYWKNDEFREGVDNARKV